MEWQSVILFNRYTMRHKTRLERRLQRLNHGSQQAVQNGSGLTDLDRYLHVRRPVEDSVRNELKAIQRDGGGLLLLVGSAGDGKSHLISIVKESGEFGDFAFHNDGTESGGPTLSAVETLKYALSEFADSRIDETDDKMVVAINLGKLLDLADDPDVKLGFRYLAETGGALSGDLLPEKTGHPRIHVVSMAHQQAFEMHVDDDSEYPFSSVFMSGILDRLVEPNEANPFYKDFQDDIKNTTEPDPVLLNYRMLCMPSVRDTLVKLIIEASFRFNLMFTPRDYFDFIYSIIVPKNLARYNESEDFFSTSLPNLVFDGSDNKIQRALSRLDPIKTCSIDHDRSLSKLYSMFAFTPDLFDGMDADLTDSFGEILERFYQNHLDDKSNICALQFRLQHLLEYHSDSNAFKAFVRDLVGYWREDTDCWERIADMVSAAIPRHYGTYISYDDLIPLNIQGANYKLFAYLRLPDCHFQPDFNKEEPHVFDPAIAAKWIFEKEGHSHILSLRLDYVLYEHLYELLGGKLSTSFDNDRNLAFSRFVRDLAKLSNAGSEVKVVDCNGNMKTLSVKYNKIQLR